MRYAFRYINYVFSKIKTLHSGMRPLVYSEKKASESKIGWIRAGKNIR